METLPKIDVELDHPASHFSTVCLGTPVILRKILQQFSNSELLKLSFVNKQWNFEARSVLRNRGTLTARVRSDEPTCQGLPALALDLRLMRVVPFSGVHVRLSHSGYDACKSNASLDLSYKVILGLLSWKNLSVDFHDNLANCKDCPVLALVTEALQRSYGLLEQVSLTFQRKDVELFQHVNAVLIRSSFPRLKILKLDLDNSDGHLTESARALASRAPKLQELHLMRSMDFEENLLGGRSSAVIVPWPRFNPLYERVCPRLISTLRPTEMEINRRRFEDFDAELLDRFIPMVLQASRTWLKTLRMDLLFAVPLMCYGLQLKNVTSLEICLDGNVHAVESCLPWIMKFLRGFNFSRVFPKLRKVDIKDDLAHSISASQIIHFIERGNAALKKTLPDRAFRIQQLTLRQSIFDSTPPILAQIFPHVKTISVFERHGTRAVPFRPLWGHFMYLRELRVIITANPQEIYNLDSVFCGIFPEEVAERREEDDEFLEAVNIVPVMPSITCMKDLRSLTVRYVPEPNNFPAETDATFMFSKVTGFIAFARCPALAVTFQTVSHECAEALSHMKPYVSFVIEE